ncbi:MAG TPA: ATP-dependent DNA ligase, partial [Actinomycetota bacterium]|nr:ATP-dependent DNA ligase [Actinomycetota bacterium]
MATGLLDALPEQERRLLRRVAHPDWVPPMLATLTDRRFSDPDWIFERKLDGERALGFRDGTRVRLLSRNRKDLYDTYPEVVEAL